MGQDDILSQHMCHPPPSASSQPPLAMFVEDLHNSRLRPSVSRHIPVVSLIDSFTRRGWDNVFFCLENCVFYTSKHSYTNS